MTDDAMEVVGGSGNVFRDFGYPDADVRQAKAILAAQIIKILDEEKLSTRQAEVRTGVAHSEFVRIRRINLARFTIDRLMTILERLGSGGRDVGHRSSPRPAGYARCGASLKPATAGRLRGWGIFRTFGRVKRRQAAIASR